MQRNCTQPRRTPLICLRCDKEGHFARDCPEPPPAGVPGGKGKGSAPVEGKGKGNGGQSPSQVRFPHAPHPCESAMVVQWEEDFPQALFCVILPMYKKRVRL